MIFKIQCNCGDMISPHSGSSSEGELGYEEEYECEKCNNFFTLNIKPSSNDKIVDASRNYGSQESPARESLSSTGVRTGSPRPHPVETCDCDICGEVRLHMYGDSKPCENHSNAGRCNECDEETTNIVGPEGGDLCRQHPFTELHAGQIIALRHPEMQQIWLYTVMPRGEQEGVSGSESIHLYLSNKINYKDLADMNF